MSRKQKRKHKKPIRPRRSPLALLLILLCGAALGAFASSSAPRVLASLWPSADAIPRLRLHAPEWPSLSERLRGPEFSLRTIEFMGLSQLGAHELWPLAALSTGTPLVNINPDAVCNALSQHPRVLDCAATRVPPARLLVEIDERVPIARIANSSLAVDAEGARFPQRSSDASLPLLRGDATAALALIDAARFLSEPLEMVIAESERAIWFVPPGEPIRVRLGERPELGLQTWRRLRESGLLEGSKAEGAREVDLRFEGNAVLRDFQGSKGRNGDGAKR